MSQKKALPPKPAPPAAAPKKSPPAQPTKNKTVAYDPRLLDAFLLGRLTLGELEGVGKDVQYKMAERGFAALSEGKLDMAKTIFKGLLALDPYDSYFHTAMASALQREGKYAEAEAQYTTALSFNPHNSTALANRGEIRFQTGKVVEAAEDLRRSVDEDPKGRDPASVRARVLLMAISETILENKDLILQELKNAQQNVAAKSPGKPSPKAPAKSAPKPAPVAKRAVPVKPVPKKK